MLLAVPYLGVAYWCTTLLDAEGPGWLNLIVLLCVWSGFKMLWLGPVSLVLLIRAKMREFGARRRAAATVGQQRSGEQIEPGLASLRS